MPMCVRCGSMKASVEMRKIPKRAAYVCKDREACAERRLRRMKK